MFFYKYLQIYTFLIYELRFEMKFRLEFYLCVFYMLFKMYLCLIKFKQKQALLRCNLSGILWYTNEKAKENQYLTYCQIFSTTTKK